jgi:hypothetical protein
MANSRPVNPPAPITRQVLIWLIALVPIFAGSSLAAPLGSASNSLLPQALPAQAAIDSVVTNTAVRTGDAQTGLTPAFDAAAQRWN